MDERRTLMRDSSALSIATIAIMRYAETHPRPPHVTQVQAAAMLGVSAQTVCKLVRHGTFRLNALGMIPIGQIDAALLAT